MIEHNLQLNHRYLVKRYNMIMEVHVLEITDTCVKLQNLVSDTVFWVTHEDFSSDYEMVENLGYYSYGFTYTPDPSTITITPNDWKWNDWNIDANDNSGTYNCILNTILN